MMDELMFLKWLPARGQGGGVMDHWTVESRDGGVYVRCSKCQAYCLWTCIAGPDKNVPEIPDYWKGEMVAQIKVGYLAACLDCKIVYVGRDRAKEQPSEEAK